VPVEHVHMEFVLYELGRLWHAAWGTKEQCVVIGLVWPSSAAPWSSLM
jgi:hypothetical protein